MTDCVVCVCVCVHVNKYAFILKVLSFFSVVDTMDPKKKQ